MYIVYIEHTTGCEADATSREFLAVCETKELAESYANKKRGEVKWKDYYMGTLEIESIELIE